MKGVLFAWIGNTDLKAVGLERPQKRDDSLRPPRPRGTEDPEPGPIARVLGNHSWGDKVHKLVLLDDSGQGHAYWDKLLEKGTSLCSRGIRPEIFSAPHNDPTFNPVELSKVYEFARDAVSARPTVKNEQRLYLISGGTNIMMLAWVLLSQTRGFEAKLLQSSEEEEVKEFQLPLDLSYQYLPSLARASDSYTASILQISNTDALASMTFREPSPLHEVLGLAEAAAKCEFPVLVTGESGSGKEGIARHIHEISRNGQPFVSVNCGAVPAELFESEFFGHDKGAFTGAAKAKPGYFEQAGDGTLFLDELGELTLPHQAKLLRVLQEGEAWRVGGRQAYEVNCRVVAATHRNLQEEVRQGRFREDLFYRLVVVRISLPPLRERPGDIKPIAKRKLEKICENSKEFLGQMELSPDAWNAVFQHPWPGNVRELESTLMRAALASAAKGENAISGATLKDSLFPALGKGLVNTLLEMPLENGFRFDDVMDELKHHYYCRAMRQTQGNMAAAARLLGRSRIDDWLNSWNEEKKDAWKL